MSSLKVAQIIFCMYHDSSRGLLQHNDIHRSKVQKVIFGVETLSLGMREPGDGVRKWFDIDSKSFEISVEGEDNKFKGFITERRKGLVSWIRFGESRLRNLLKGMEIIRKEESKVKRVFD